MIFIFCRGALIATVACAGFCVEVAASKASIIFRDRIDRDVFMPVCNIVECFPFIQGFISIHVAIITAGCFTGMY